MFDLILSPTSVRMKPNKPPKFREDHLQNEGLKHVQNEIQGIQLCCHHPTLSRSDCSSFIAAKKCGQNEMVSMNLVDWIRLRYLPQ